MQDVFKAIAERKAAKRHQWGGYRGKYGKQPWGHWGKKYGDKEKDASWTSREEYWKQRDEKRDEHWEEELFNKLAIFW